MSYEEPSSIPTRPSLLNRLKSGDNVESWHDFYRIYGKLVRDFSIHAGLTETEADEVVQDTAIAMARLLPAYRYDPKKCRFKTWLLNQTSWRIKDQFRKRKKDSRFIQSSLTNPGEGETSSLANIDRFADPLAPDLERVLEAQWRQSMFALALGRVKEKFSPKQFQIFDLLVLKEWPTADVARSLGISMAKVYVTRHRISAAIIRETKQLEKEMERKIG